MFKSMDREFLSSLALLDEESEGKLLSAMLHTYCSVWPGYIQRLRQSFHQKDYQGLSEHAMAFRTLVGNFGASKLMTVLADMERAGLTKNWDTAQQSMKDLKKELCHFQEDIELMRLQKIQQVS